MNKNAVLISIRPKLEMPFKCYIYCTFPQKPIYTLWLNRGKDTRFLADGKVVGEFVCDEVFVFENSWFDEGFNRAANDGRINLEQLALYLGEKGGFGWHISDLKIYDKPKELSDFKRHDNTYDNSFGWCFEDKEKSYKLKRPPQSWCYVEMVGE